MSHLVRHHVRLSEIARRAEALIEFAEERQVDIDLLIAGTVEGSHRGLAETARRLGGVAEEHERRWLIGAASLLEDLAEGVLCVSEHDADELRLRVVGRRRAARLGLDAAAGSTSEGTNEVQRVLAC